MKNTYFIKTKNTVLVNQDHIFEIQANSQAEAEAMVKKNLDQHDDYVKTSMGDIRTSNNFLAIGGLVALGFAFLLSLVSWKDGHDSLNIYPNLIACGFSFALSAALILRGKNRNWSGFEILYFIALSLATAPLFRAALAVTTWRFLWVFHLTFQTYILLGVGILMCLIGLKIVGVFCYGVVILIAANNLTAINDAMGIAGAIFVLCLAIGAIGLMSISNSVTDNLPFFKKGANVVYSRLQSDVEGSKQQFGSVVNFASKHIKGGD